MLVIFFSAALLSGVSGLTCVSPLTSPISSINSIRSPDCIVGVDVINKGVAYDGVTTLDVDVLTDGIVVKDTVIVQTFDVYD